MLGKTEQLNCTSWPELPKLQELILKGMRITPPNFRHILMKCPSLLDLQLGDCKSNFSLAQLKLIGRTWPNLKELSINIKPHTRKSLIEKVLVGHFKCIEFLNINFEFKKTFNVRMFRTIPSLRGLNGYIYRDYCRDEYGINK